MKKILSAVLASAMVLSMGVASFAAVDTYEGPFEYNSSYNFMYDANEAYGDTIYYALVDDANELVHDYDLVKSTSIRQSWEMGKEAVSSLSIVKKKATDTVSSDYNGSLVNGITSTFPTGEKYFYFLALELASNPTETSSTDVIGEITLKKSGNTDGFEMEIDVNLEVAFDGIDSNFVVTSTATVFDFGNGDSEEWIEFSAHSGYDYFIVDTCDQDDLVLSVDADYDSDIAAAYPTANLHFFNGNYATFNRIGELYLHDCGAMNAEYVYAINKDGEVEAVAYTYDEYEDAFIINTRTLGRYVLSDKELELTSDEAVEDDKVTVTPESSKPNPGTGAVA